MIRTIKANNNWLWAYNTLNEKLMCHFDNVNKFCDDDVDVDAYSFIQSQHWVVIALFLSKSLCCAVDRVRSFAWLPNETKEINKNKSSDFLAPLFLLYSFICWFATWKTVLDCIVCERVKIVRRKIRFRKMSLRELVDPECGGANPLMRLGTHLIHDAAHKDDGIAGAASPHAGAAGPAHFASHPMDETHLVNEFLGQMAAPPPQSFRMDALLQEMREIDARNYPTQVMRAPPVADEINKGLAWSNEYQQKSVTSNLENSNMIAVGEQVTGMRECDRCVWMAILNTIFIFQIWQNEQRFQGQTSDATTLTRDFFDAALTSDGAFRPQIPPSIAADAYHSRYALNDRFRQAAVSSGEPWTDEFSAIERQLHGDSEWVKDFEEHKASEGT